MFRGEGGQFGRLKGRRGLEAGLKLTELNVEMRQRPLQVQLLAAQVLQKIAVFRSHAPGTMSSPMPGTSTEDIRNFWFGLRPRAGVGWQHGPVSRIFHHFRSDLP